MYLCIPGSGSAAQTGFEMGRTSKTPPPFTRRGLWTLKERAMCVALRPKRDIAEHHPPPGSRLITDTTLPSPRSRSSTIAPRTASIRLSQASVCFQRSTHTASCTASDVAMSSWFAMISVFPQSNENAARTVRQKWRQCGRRACVMDCA